MNNPLKYVTIAAIMAGSIMHAGAEPPAMLARQEITDTPCGQVALEGRCALGSGRKARTKRQSWKLVWDMDDTGRHKWVELSSDPRNRVDGVDVPSVDLTVGENNGRTDSIIDKTTLTSSIDTNGGFNSILMEWADGNTRIFAGNRGMQLIFDLQSARQPHGSCGIASTDDIDVQDLILECLPLKSHALQTGMTVEQIKAVATEQPGKPTGMWEFMDRENDPALARPGGRYILAITDSGTPGTYLIIYMDGAQINAGNWKPGMLKGKLEETPFEQHYKLTWYDAMMEPMEHDIHADMPNRVLLSLEFPLMRTLMRFSRRK